MPLIKRIVKGEILTWAELDGNFDYLDSVKINKSLLAGGNRVLVQILAEGEPQAIELPESHVLGRLTGGQLAAVPMSSIEVSGASEAYVDAADAALQAQITALEGVIDTTLKAPEAYTPAGGLYPTTYGGEAITKGDSFRLGAGNMGAIVVNAEDLLVALVDAPGQVDANWQVLESNRDQATESIKGVAQVSTQAIIEDSATVNDTDIVTPKKWWQGWTKGLTLASFFTAVRGTVLTGLSLADSTDVVASDSILVGIGKLQAQIDALGGGGGLTNWSEGRNTTAPNATVPVVYFQPNTADSNNDVVVAAKGTGAHIAQIPDSTATAGNKRGNYAVDWQKTRNAADQVASGASSTIAGGHGCKASGQYSFAVGVSNGAVATNAIAAGGEGNSAANFSAGVFGGNSNAANAEYSGIFVGRDNTIQDFSCYRAVIIGGSLCYVPSGGAYAFGSGINARPYLYTGFARAAGSLSANGDCQTQVVQKRRSAAGVASAGTVEVLLNGADNTYLMIPYTNNRSWDVEVRWLAVVTAIAGSADGLTVGDTVRGIDRFCFRRLAGTSAIVGATDSGTKTGSASMTGGSMGYAVGASNNLTSTFTGPTFTGGGTITLRVTAVVSLVEIAW